jgi:F-type H+-transporting ATPase subunit b
LSIFQSKLSFFFRGFWLAAFLAIAAPAFAPVRGAAQQSAPAAPVNGATGGSASGSGSARPAQPVQQNEQGDAALLHSSAVKWFARFLHLPLDIAVTLLLVINFAVIFFAIAIPLTKTMPKVFRGRSETLSKDLNEARKATADAQARLSAVEAQLAGLGEEIKKLSAQVEQESREDEKRIKAAIGEESSRIVAAAEQEIEVALTQAKRGLRSLAADLAIGQAEKQIVLTAETDRALIAEFITGVAGDGKGGRN